MSYRERQNRKDASGKTPEQIRAGQAAHEARYEEITQDQDTLGIRPGAMGRAWRELMDEVWWRDRDEH